MGREGRVTQAVVEAGTPAAGALRCWVSTVSIRALLFTDIEGSTGLIQRLGGRFAGVLERHHEIIRSAVLIRDGVEESREGDSLFVTFPSATAALEGAVDAQCQIEREPWPPDGRVRVRMGLHVGEVAETGAGLIGLAIHQAARIGAAAHGGQIVLSSDVVTHLGLLPADVGLRPLGRHELRDVGRVKLYQVEHPDLQVEFARLRTKVGFAHNLPAAPTVLVGRRSEAAAVSVLLEQHRLVSLIGEGGCGKTRLALRVAASALSRFVDGVWFVDLAPVAGGADVTQRVAQVVGVRGALQELLEALSQRELLLVLDNCEHVLDSVAAVVTALLSECPAASVLATSRAPLNVAGEALYRVPPLTVARREANLSETLASDAVELFVARTRLVRPGYEPNELEVGLIVDVCRRLEGLPLSIELAAARLRAMSVQELGHCLDDRFTVLVGGSRSAPQRQQTLRATVEWSFRLLTPVEQSVLRHLAVFRGGCDLDSAQAVCAAVGSRDAMLDLMIHLVDQSLVTAVEHDGVTRYGLHEAIREFALESAPDHERGTIEERHAHWFAILAQRLGSGPEPSGDRVWIRGHDLERDNLRAAAEWHAARDAPAALRLLLAALPGMDETPQSEWCFNLVRRVLPDAAESPPSEQAHAFALLAGEALIVDYGTCHSFLTRAVELLEHGVDAVAETMVLATVAMCHAMETGRSLDDREVVAAVSAADRAGGTYWPFDIRRWLSTRAYPALSESLSLDALRIAEQNRLGIFAAQARANIAVCAQFRGHSDQALKIVRQLLPDLDDLIIYASRDLEYLPLVEGEHGDLAVGLHLGEDLLSRHLAGSHDPGVVSSLCAVVAHLRRLAGEWDRCALAAELAMRSYGHWVNSFVGGLALITRSALWRHQSHPDEAAVQMKHSCDTFWPHGLTDIAMRIMEELAAVALALNRPDDAANLLATARDARTRAQKPLSPACRPEIEALQTMLGERRGRPLRQGTLRSLAHSMAPR